jgi:hypothetical protein
MRFNRITLAVSFSLLIGFIVVPPSHTVNYRSTIEGSPQTQLADGSPLPLPPTNASEAVLLADGSPLPPLPPTNAIRTAQPAA